MIGAEFLNFSWQIQVALSSGYAAYAIAYVGMRDRHRATDKVFIVLVFGLLATLVLYWLREQSPIIATLAALGGTCALGLIWRRIGIPLLPRALRFFNVSWVDDAPSALATLGANTEHPVTQISVQLDDGRWLRCDDVAQFSGAPYAPFLIGPTGDVALYLTHDEDRPQGTVSDPNYGYRITYVPAAHIRCLNIRHAAR